MVSDAQEIIRRVGVVESSGGNLKLRFPDSERVAVQPAIDILRIAKAEAVALLARQDRTDLERASTVLNLAGVRIMALEAGATIGVWSDLDGPEIRGALKTLKMDDLPVRYLDGVGVPLRYKARRVQGEPVPMNVLAEMERHPAEPWKVRDRMLNEMGSGNG